MSDGQVRDPYPLVHNKVLSPHFINPTLRRGRLIDWLNQHADCRAIVVAADAGYGKTTLLWQWEREVAFDCYWYKLDRSDRDWSLQISYLIEAVRDRHEGFGMRTVSLLGQIGAASAHGRATVTASLIAELNERIVEPATFIVDDWQFVASVTEVRGFWNQVLRDSSNKCRFVFLARAKPQLQFARFAAHGGYAELRTDALRFTEAEIGQLFGEVYQDPLAPEELIEVERRTEGWAASLQLIEVSLRERTTPDERRAFIESITATRDSDLFNFLAEEVLDQQPEQTRNFLLFTSILTQITPELAERMTGVHEGRKLLNELEHRGIFTFRLDPETMRYRYHGLFRDFLERCLKQERTDAEVAGLHIHAASYFETHAQWPDAIHHYLAAGLTTQAARLIARYGEEVVAGGRLGLIDEWLAQIPPEIVRANARLSLLWGEALGMRGEWKPALATLDRARKFFHRKGDARMEALAYAKLSNVLMSTGEVERAAVVAQRGLDLVPADAPEIELRLQGNYAVTGTWMTGDLTEVAFVCHQIAHRATESGLDHFAAIAHHNIGVLARKTGDLRESRDHLERAAKFWADLDRTPYGDNAELVHTLLNLGEVELGERYADQGLRNTAPWPRPRAEAMISRASVDVYKGNFDAALIRLHQLLGDPEYLGGLAITARSVFMEAATFTSVSPARLRQAEHAFSKLVMDPREAPLAALTDAVADHVSRRCSGQCRLVARSLAVWDRQGATRDAAIGRMKLAVLRSEHDQRQASRLAVEALQQLPAAADLRYLRHWCRRLAPLLDAILRIPGGVDSVLRLVEADPEYWREILASKLANLTDEDRHRCLAVLSRYPAKSLIAALGEVDGDDVADARRNMILTQAARVFVRTIGRMQLHRGSWETSSTSISRHRSRALLGLLVAFHGRSLTRDLVLEYLWPDSTASAATNSLNQAVFTLRRTFDPDYRDGLSPAYIISTPELVSLQSSLVVTDLDEFRRLAARLRDGLDIRTSKRVMERLVELVRGEFLADLRYESWVASVQPSVHAELRQHLLPIAIGTAPGVAPDLSIRAATALISMDEYDEQAYLAIADRLSHSGRRVAAREVISRYARKLQEELDEPPSLELAAALTQLGAPQSISI